MAVDLKQLKSDVHLSASVEELEQIYNRLKEAIADLSEAERFSYLLIAEREILGERGHDVILRFGYNLYDNPRKCIICGGNVDKNDRGIMITSRWENTRILLTYHEECLDGREYEIGYDLLTGDPTSKIGLP